MLWPGVDCHTPGADSTCDHIGFRSGRFKGNRLGTLVALGHGGQASAMQVGSGSASGRVGSTRVALGHDRQAGALLVAGSTSGEASTMAAAAGSTFGPVAIGLGCSETHH